MNTPQQPESSGTISPADFFPRLGAFIIDFVVTNGAEFVVEYAAVLMVLLVRKYGMGQAGVTFSNAMDPLLEQGIGFVFGLGFTYYYYVPLQLKLGTTPGKKVFSLYVVDANTHARINRKQAIFRVLGYIPSTVIFGAGFLMAAFHPQRKALHDVIAGTQCVKIN